jgi:mono/diheme cytochrome c family protein
MEPERVPPQRLARRDDSGDGVRIGTALAILGLGLAVASAAGPAPRSGNSGDSLPILGARLSEFPEGPGKTIADKACLQCHSADIPRQQRITEKQWTAEVEKMTRWGAEVSAADKDALIAYLASHFGPANDAFHPVEVRPTMPGPRRPDAGR